MAETAMRTYTVAYARDEGGWWVASVRELRGCHTQGRTLDQARRRIREALGLFVRDAKGARLVDVVRLPRDVRRVLARQQAARHRAMEASAEAQAALRKAARTLQSLRLPLRDVGALLGLSHQRVHQIANGQR
jgi:predicted RNase H-like HicB family nuclease